MFEEKHNYQTVIFGEAGSENGINETELIPKDLTDIANERLGLLALALSAVCIFSYLYHYIIRVIVNDQLSFKLNVPVVIIIFVSLFVSFIIRRRVFQTTTLHVIGIAYLILTALLIIIGHTTYEWWISRDRLQGVSWVCVWIVLFPIVVPSPTFKAALIALSMAVMGPVGLFIATTYLGRAPAPPTAYLDLFVPNLISAVMAIYLSRIIFNLGKDVQAARRMGSYFLQHKLGEGGMGEVWQATHRMLSRPAAIKLIQPEILDLSNSQVINAKERFFKEAKITSSLTSPHTVELYDFGITNDKSFYYVMELLNGDDLNWLVKRSGPMPANRVVYLMIQMCESLTEAHNAGLIHRDIKPANIFVCQLGMQYDFIKILDFGLAKPVADMKNLPASSFLEGTPAFMAPESMLKDTVINKAVDIYAIGCVAYWMLTAQFTIDNMSNDLPTPPSQLTKNTVPDEFEILIMSCLNKDPEKRPQSTEDMAKALSNCLFDEPWTNELAREWWQKQYGDYENNNPNIDPEAVTEIG